MPPTQKQSPQRPKSQALAIAAVALAVLGVAGYVWWSSGKPAPDQNSAPRPTREQETVTRTRNLIATGQREQARDLAAGWVQTHPDDVKVRPLLVKALLLLGQTDQAKQVLADVDRLAPAQAQGIWMHGELAKIGGEADYVKYFTRAVESPTVEPEMYSLYALELLARGDDAGAQKYVKRAIDAGLADAPTLQARAQLAIKQGQPAAAIEHLRSALKLDRSNAACWGMLADAQLRLGQPESAGQTLDEAIKSCRDKTALYFELGQVRSAQSQPAQSADAFAMAADPEILTKAQRLQAAVGAAEGYYKTARYALAMKYIDLAATLDSSDKRVQELMPKIENARFTAETKPAK